MAEKNVVYSINGPVVTVKDTKAFSMLEMVYVGHKGLVGEVIGITDPANTYSRKILLRHGFSRKTVYTIDDGSTAEVFERLL